MTSKTNVYHYWPNRVDYLRLICLLVGLYLAVIYPMTGLALIVISCLLDALDGLLARKLNQGSILGSALDFAIDRMTTCGIVIMLIRISPHWWFFWLLIALLDSGSHFMHLYASLPQSVNNHKKMDKAENKFLKQYYTNRGVLFTSCLVHDLFFMVVYIYHYYPSVWLIGLGVIFGIGFVHKTTIHVLQIISAIQKLAHAHDAPI